MTSELDLPAVPNIRTLVSVTGLFDPDIFTMSVTLAPTRIIRAGEPRSPQLKFAEDAWKVDLGKRESVHLENEVDRLLELLFPVSKKFQEVVKEMGLSAEAVFQINVENGRYPSISLRPDQIAKLAVLGLSLDIDII